MTESRQDIFGWFLTPVNPFRLRNDVPESVSSSEQGLRHPEGRTAATSRSDDDEWSDENMRRWEEADKLDPVLAEWLKAQRGE
jgi:hypothetical protein